MSLTVPHRCDVAVLGAGPAGAAAALALAGRGLHVVLLERASSAKRHMGESLGAAAEVPLTQLGIWPDFLAQAHEVSTLTRVAWAGKTFEKPAGRHGVGVDHHLDRARFDAWLVAHAVSAGAELVVPARVRSVRPVGAGGYTLHLEDGTSARTLHSNYLVDASGRSSWAMHRLGARSWRADSLIAQAYWLRCTTAEPTVLVESAPDGWWYSAPLGRDLLVSAHFHGGTTGARALDPGERPGHDTLERASLHPAPSGAPHTAARLGRAQAVAMATYPASPQLTLWQPLSRCLPVGDAAMCFDPIAAHGLWFALHSAVRAAQVIGAWRSGMQDAGVAYRDFVHTLFERHMRARAAHYASEAPFRSTPFWLRPRGLGPGHARQSNGVRYRQVPTALGVE